MSKEKNKKNRAESEPTAVELPIPEQELPQTDAQPESVAEAVTEEALTQPAVEEVVAETSVTESVPEEEIAEASVAASPDAATIESNNTPAPEFTEPEVASVTPVNAQIEPVAEDERVVVSKKALYKMMVALSRGQIQYYTSFQIIPRIGDLFGLTDIPSQQEKWDEIKQWVEGQKL